MFSEISALTKFINQNTDLKLLISRIQESDNDFWLVGGCLRNFLLHLPQVDIDITCSGDPTVLTQAWAAEVSGRWFWLDSKRKQSRVLLQNGLTLDFAPLRAPSIIEDLQLRDFTINSLALPLNESFPESALIDPVSGLLHLQKKQLQISSQRSFSDDPLRMLKGIRHAVTLNFNFSVETQRQITSYAQLLTDVAGERIREELGKIFNAENVIRGIELLIVTNLLEVLLGPVGNDWDKRAAVVEIDQFNKKMYEVGLTTKEALSKFGSPELLSYRAIFLFTRLLKRYSPCDLPKLLHHRLRLNRKLQRLIIELQAEPDLEMVSLAATLEGQRLQALLVELLQPFACEKLLYWGVCSDLLTLKRVLELQASYAAEQKFGRVPDLLNGRSIAVLLEDSPNTQIGEWQSMLKLAEINSEISTITEAENWLRAKLSFDNKEA